MKSKVSRLASLVLGNRFLRFLLVGLINAAFGYGCFALFLFLGLHYAPAMLLATVLGVLFNFKSTGRLVFGSNDNRLIFRFCAAYAIIYAINTSSIGLLASAGMSHYLAGAVLIPPMAVLSFLLNKKFVFTS